MTHHRRLIALRPGLALAVALVVAISAGCVGSPVPSPASSPTSSAEPSLAPDSTPTASVPSTSGASGWASLTWLEGVALADGQFVADLVPWRDGYVGVGGVDTGVVTGSNIDSAFFTSSDGIRWKLVHRQASTDGEYVAGVVAGRLVRIGNRLLAVGGAVMNAPGGLPDFAPPLWVSDDGTTWAQVQSASWDAESVWPAWLISGPEGVLAISSGREDSTVLHSLDGLTWTRATLPAAAHVIVRDAIVQSNGFVLVGRDGQRDIYSEVCDPACGTTGAGRPAAWISPDGVHWSEATVAGDEVVGGQLSRVVVDRAGLLAAGWDGQTTSWASADGQLWSIVGDAASPFADSTYPIYTSDGVHAVVFGRAPDGSNLTAWVSYDSTTWTRLSLESAANAPKFHCREEDCVRVERIWLVPDGLIVMGPWGPIPPQTAWFAEPGP